MWHCHLLGFWLQAGVDQGISGVVRMLWLFAVSFPSKAGSSLGSDWEAPSCYRKAPGFYSRPLATGLPMVPTYSGWISLVDLSYMQALNLWPEFWKCPVKVMREEEVRWAPRCSLQAETDIQGRSRLRRQH